MFFDSLSYPILFYLILFCNILFYSMGFPGGSVVKNLPAKQEMQVQSLGQEDPLKKEIATNSSILTWEIRGSEETGGLQFMGSQKFGHDSVQTHTHTFNYIPFYSNLWCFTPDLKGTWSPF